MKKTNLKKRTTKDADEVIKILDEISGKKETAKSEQKHENENINKKKTVKLNNRNRNNNVLKKTKPNLVDKTKLYSLSEAIELLKKINKSKFKSSLELHLNTTEKGIKMNVSLPHGTGKQVKVSVVDDTVLSNIDKGIIDFDILIAHPSYMPKLAKYAKILGPKGLMPNPKNGTVTPNVEKAKSDFSKGQVQIKTESNFPLIHLSVGKLDMQTQDLSENVKAVIESIKKNKIKSAFLAGTMTPSVKLDIEKI